MNIRETFTHFLAQKKAENLSERTLDNYIYSLQGYLTDNGLDDLAEITCFTSLNFINWVYYQQQETSRTIPSINHFIRDMRVYINFLIEEYELPPVRMKLLKSPSIAMARYSSEDCEALLAQPKRTDLYHTWRTWLIINIMLATGARIGSVCKLKKEDVSNNTIVFKHTKNGKEHTLPLSPSLKLALLKFNSLWQTDSEYLLISSKEGAELTPTGAYQALQDYCISRGVKCLGWHALRHTFAFMSWKNGMDLVTLQTFLQHSSIELTRHYIGALGAEDLSEVSVPLDRLCKAKKHISKK